MSNIKQNIVEILKLMAVVSHLTIGVANSAGAGVQSTTCELNVDDNNRVIIAIPQDALLTFLSKTVTKAEPKADGSPTVTKAEPKADQRPIREEFITFFKEIWCILDQLRPLIPEDGSRQSNFMKTLSTFKAETLTDIRLNGKSSQYLISMSMKNAQEQECEILVYYRDSGSKSIDWILGKEALSYGETTGGVHFFVGGKRILDSSITLKSKIPNWNLPNEVKSD